MVTRSAQAFDILALRGGITAEFGLPELSTGSRVQMRLGLTDPRLMVGARNTPSSFGRATGPNSCSSSRAVSGSLRTP